MHEEVWGTAQPAARFLPSLSHRPGRSDPPSDMTSPTFENELSKSPETIHIVDSLSQSLESRRNALLDRSSQTVASRPNIPEALAQGVPMIKISNRKIKQRTFRLQSPTASNAVLEELVGDRRGVEGYATICWESRKIGRSEYIA